jgi:sec-independent protein translocase protein TatB
MGPIGVPELLVIFVIALIVFGPKKLPDLGRSLGKSISEFKRASNELRNTLEEEVRIEEQKEQRKALASDVASASNPESVSDPAVLDLPPTDPSMIHSEAADVLAEAQAERHAALDPQHADTPAPGETVARGTV